VSVEFLTIASEFSITPSGDFKIVTNAQDAVVSDMLNAAGFSNLERSDGRIYVYPNRTEEVAEAAGGEATLELYPEPLEEEEEGEEREEEEEREEGRSFEIPMPEMREMTREVLLQILPNLVTPEDGGSIKLCADKIREFERVWGQALTMKRQIEGMMSEIDQNAVVKQMDSDIEYLTQKCECIDSIKVGTNGHLFIFTKEIVTENQQKYGSRILGRMRISIDLRYMYPKLAPNSNYAKAVRIYNLDRNPESGGCFWSCGHVQNTYDDGQSICWGGFYQQLFDAFVSKSVPQLFDTIMRFITQPYESDEWGCRVRLFPEANINEA